MLLSPDIKRIVESAEGVRFKEINEARWSRRNKAASATYGKKLQVEQSRHFARMKALDAEYAAAKNAAREAFHDAERQFFNRRLASSTPNTPHAAGGG